jgi:hypothetical protein
LGQVINHTFCGNRYDLWVCSLTDQKKIIHAILDRINHIIVSQKKLLNNKLGDLGLSISAGKMADFGARAFIINIQDKSTPLIQPTLKKAK